jgi:hypothetical protein
MILVSITQLLIAISFAAMATIAYRHGNAAQRAADAEAARQGLPNGTLARHQIRIEESKAEMALPLAIAAAFAVLSGLNATAAPAGRTLTWIMQPLILIAGGFVTAGQVFVVRHVQAVARRSDDPALRKADIRAIITSAQAAFPSWVRPLIVLRFFLVTVGSLVILVLLLMT